MNLKIRLALLFGLSVLIILVVSSTSVYFLNKKIRKVEFIKRLISEAQETGALFFSVPQPSPVAIEQLYQHTLHSLPEENIFIYDSSFHILYATPRSHPPHLPPQAFRVTRQNKSYFFSDGSKEGILLSVKEKPAYISVLAHDFLSNQKSDNLKLILAISTMGGILFSALLAFFYVKQSIKPLEELKKQIEKINEENLQERIQIGTNNNEVSEIANKFNAMLDRIEQAFEQRKSFVQHASHELRTPLANMLAQTESALNKILHIEDYRRILYSLREDQQYLIDLTNALLALSQYEKITSKKDWVPLRIDEILFETAELVKQEWRYANINVDFETLPQNENDLIVKGNESLIRSAVMNLIKNAIQYSKDQGVKISIDSTETGIILHFDNIGKRLTIEEQAKLFIPFFRGNNSKYKKGYGLGLSIVKKIVTTHGGTINYHSLATDINRFTVFLPAASKS